MQIIATGLFH
jgi:dodecin